MSWKLTFRACTLTVSGAFLGCWIAMALAGHTRTSRQRDPCHQLPLEARSHLSSNGIDLFTSPPPAVERILADGPSSWPCKGWMSPPDYGLGLYRGVNISMQQKSEPHMNVEAQSVPSVLLSVERRVMSARAMHTQECNIQAADCESWWSTSLLMFSYLGLSMFCTAAGIYQSVPEK